MPDTTINIGVKSSGFKTLIRDTQNLQENLGALGLTGTDAFAGLVGGAEDAGVALGDVAKGAGKAKESTRALGGGSEALQRSLGSLAGVLSELIQKFDTFSGRGGGRPTAPSPKPVDQLTQALKRLEQQEAFATQAVESEAFFTQLQKSEKAAQALKELQREAAESVREIDEVQDSLESLRQEEAFNKQLLQSKEYTEQLRRTARTQRALERVGQSFTERFAGVLEIFENLTGTIDLALLAVEAFAGSFKLLREGALLGDLDAASKALGVNAQALRDASGGQLTGAQAQQAGLRGVDAGLTREQTRATVELARVLASKQALLEGFDPDATLGALADELQTELVDELRTGELGPSLERLGVTAEVLDAALREEASARGTIVDGLSEQTRREVLLGAALDGARLEAQRFGTDGAASLDAFQTSLIEAGNTLQRFAAGASDTTERAETLDDRIRSSARGTLEAVQRDLATIQDQGSLARGGSFVQGAIAAQEASLGATTQQRTAALQEQARLLEMQIIAEESINTLNVTRESLAQNLRGETREQVQAQVDFANALETAAKRAQNIQRLALEDIAARQKSGALTKEQADAARASLENQRLLGLLQFRGSEALRDQLVTTKGLSFLEADRLSRNLTVQDALKEAQRVQRQSLSDQSALLETEAKRLQQQLASVEGLDKQRALEVQIKIAALEVEQALIAQSSTIEEANTRLESQRVQQRLLLDEALMRAEAEADRTRFQTEGERATAAATLAAARLRKEVFETTDNLAAQNALLAKGAIVGFFDAGKGSAERFREAIGLSEDGFDSLINKASVLAGVVNTVSGNLLLSDSLLAGALQEREAPEKPTKPTRGARRGPTEEDIERLQREVDLQGLTDSERKIEEVINQFEDNVARFGKSAEGLALARQLSAANLQDAINAREAELTGEIFGESLIGGMLSGIGRGTDLVQREVQELARLDLIQDTVAELRVEFSAPDAGTLEALIQPLKERRDELIANTRATGEQELEIRRVFEEQELELILEFNEAQREAISERTAAREEARAADLESAASSHAQIGESLAELERGHLRLASTREKAAVLGIAAAKKSVVEAEKLGAKLIRLNEAVRKNEISKAQAQIVAAGSLVSASGQVAAGFIKDERAKAVILAISETAAGLASAAIPDPVAAGLHFASAAQYGIIAGSSGGGGGAGAGAAAASGGGPLRSFAPGGTGGGGGGFGGGSPITGGLAPIVPEVSNQPLVFLQVNVDPVTGETIIRQANAEASRGSGLTLDGRLTPVGAGARRNDFVEV